MAIYLTAFFFLLSFCADPASCTDELQRSKDTETVGDMVRRQEIVENMRIEITKEIETLGDNHWAGEYTRGEVGSTGRRPEEKLLISPQNGFIFVEYGDLPEFAFDGYGKVRQDNEGIILTFTFQHNTLPSSIEGGVLYPVQWEKRRYLIAEKDIINFCNSVNSGEEAEVISYGRFLLRGGKRTVVHGLPLVQEKYRKYLLAKPLEAKVIGVEESPEALKSKEGNQGAVMTIDIGEKNGVYAGMQLYFKNIDYYISRVEVFDLREDTCKIRFAPILEDIVPLSLPQPKIGWHLSTLSERREPRVK